MISQTEYPKNQWLNRIRGIWRRKIRSVWLAYQWPVVGALIVFTIILGVIGFEHFYAARRESRSQLDIIFQTLQLFIMKSFPGSLSTPVMVAKYSGTAVTLYVTGRALIGIFRKQIQSLRLNSIGNHVVVCGLGNKGSLFTKAFYEDGYKVIVIEKDAENSRLKRFRDHAVLILIGDATDREMLQKARIHRARYLVVVCEDDGDNAEIAVNARDLITDSKNGVLTCLVHITNPHLCNLLKEREIMAQRVDSFRMEFFNVYESGARQLFNEFPGFAKSMDQFRPHLLIVGLGAMGKSLTVHATMLWRIATEKAKQKLHITLVDKDADQKKEYLELQYSQLNDFWDLTPITLDIDSSQFHQAEFLRDEQGRCIITMVYVCLDEDSLSLSAALSLFQHLRHEKVPIVVQMSHDAGLARLFQSEDSDDGSFANLHAFGLLDPKSKTDLLMYGTHEVLAQAIHQDYLWIQKNMGITLETNPSLVPWDELPEDIKESNRRQADDIGRKLKATFCDIEPLTNWDAELFEFTPEEVEKLAAMEHQRWLNERRNEGWTYDRKSKDLKRKTSPSLLPWEKLPEDSKKHNRETICSLPIFLARAGFQIFRTAPS